MLYTADCLHTSCEMVITLRPHTHVCATGSGSQMLDSLCSSGSSQIHTGRSCKFVAVVEFFCLLCFTLLSLVRRRRSVDGSESAIKGFLDVNTFSNNCVTQMLGRWGEESLGNGST